MQSAQPQIGPRAGLRPVSMVMLNLLIVMVAIGSFDFALSLLNLTRQFAHSAARHPSGLMGPLGSVLASLLLALVAAVLINRTVVRIRAGAPPPPVSE